MSEEVKSENVVPMTPREIELVVILAEGNSSKTAAEMMGIALDTVEAHRHKIIRKLGCRNMVQVVTLFFRAGLLT